MITTKPKIFMKDGKQRQGKGFSREELKKAGTNFGEALRFGLSVDSRRKTVYEENVELVKAFLQTKKAVSKPRTKRKSKS